MTPPQVSTHDIFSDEWRACLRAHYLYALLQGDQKNVKSLHEVLLQVGFDDADIQAIHEEVRAMQHSHPTAIGEAVTNEVPERADVIDAAEDALYEEPVLAEPHEQPAVFEEAAMDEGEDLEADFESDEVPDADNEPPPTQLTLF